MPELAAYIEIKCLLEEVGAIDEELMPNELEMFRSLKAKHAELMSPDPFDVPSLEVMPRNVKIRKGYNFDPKKDAGRVINLPCTGGPKEDKLASSIEDEKRKAAF